MEIENIFHTPLCLPLEYSLSAFQARMGVAALPSLPHRSRMLTASDAHPARLSPRN